MEVTRDNATLMCSIMVNGGWRFQHFVDIVMPKLLQVYNYIIPADVKLILLPPALGDKNMVIPILKKLGFNMSQLVFYNKQTLYADGLLDTCVAPTIHPDTWRVMRAMLGVPDKFHDFIKQVKVMLLTRVNSRNKGRNILNQDDVVKFLHQRYGNDSLMLFKGGYGLSEAMTVFSRPHIVLGVHGGAFCNINFCLKGTHVVEILPADSSFSWRRNVFWEAANVMDLVYWRIYEKPNDEVNNMQVSMDKLEKVFDKIDEQLKIS